MKRYGKYGRQVGNVSLNVKWYGKYGRKVSWNMKWYGKYGRKASIIVVVNVHNLKHRVNLLCLIYIF